MHKKKRNVCFITEDFYPSFIGGQGVWGKEVVTRLAQLGERVTVLAEKRAGRQHYWKSVPGVRVILVPFCFGNQIILALLEYLYFIVRCRSTYFDILHTNQLTALFFILLRPKNIGRIVVSVHNTWDQMAMYASTAQRFIYLPFIFLESVVFRRADGIVFHTQSEKQYAVTRYRLANKETAVVPIAAPHGEHISPEARQHLRHRLAIPARTSVILFVGRLVRRKHVDTVLRALALLQKRRRKVLGMIIGQGKDRKRLESIAPQNVRFYGFVGDVAPYFQTADVFVLPSVAEGGVAIASFEAASYGLPLLLSPEAADRHILTDGRNGYIVQPTDAGALADNIEDALGHRNAFGRISSQKAKRFTWERTASGTISFYRRLLGTGANIR